MPEGEFRWLSDSEIKEIDWLSLDTNGDIGFFVECDIEYTHEIREKTKDFPLCPENRIITYDMLSPYQKKLLKDTYKKSSYKARKLTATFLDRNKMYV